MKNLYLGVLLAPYRLDYYNYIHDNMNCDVYFQLKSSEGNLFSTEELERKCTFIPKYLDIMKVFGVRQVVWNLRRLIEESNPQFIMVPEFSILTIEVILIKKIYGYKYKIISHCDDSYAMLVGKGFSRVHSWARKLCMRYLDDLILLDKKARDWYQKHYHKGIWMPLIVDSNKIDKDLIIEAKAKAAQLKELYSLQTVKTLLFVGRLIDFKNLFSLIDACVLLKFPHKLIIVGDGVQRKDLEKYAANKNANVEFVGRKNGVELTAWYYCADLFVLPSKIEAFGAVTNEALICGCNCCISQAAGSTCLIEEGGNGYLLDPYNVNDIADKITKTCNLSIDKYRTSKMIYDFTKMMDAMFKKIISL